MPKADNDTQLNMPEQETGGGQAQERREAADLQEDRRRRGKLEVPLLWFAFLHVSLIVNSLAGVASKMAGREKFLSFRFCLFYGLVLLITFAFALAWQQVLKHMSLTFAFTNKPITIIYALIWGVFIFHETVTPRMIVGALVILTGIVIGVSGND